MKRIVILFLALALLLPASSLAVTGDSPFYGEWIGQKHGAKANYNTILYYMEITRYTTCEYFAFYLHTGGGFGTGDISDHDIYSGHWEIVDDHLRIPTSGISYIDVYYDSETDTLYSTEPKITYVRVP